MSLVGGYVCMYMYPLVLLWSTQHAVREGEGRGAHCCSAGEGAAVTSMAVDRTHWADCCVLAQERVRLEAEQRAREELAVEKENARVALEDRMKRGYEE